MFGLFTPAYPLKLEPKTWVERRMLWFAERLGIDRLRHARVVTPTDEFFPNDYSGSCDDVRRCLDLMCSYMGVDYRGVTLEILPDEALPGAAGLYEMRVKGNICVSHSQAANPPRLLATLAHEVSHEILLRGGHLTGDEHDHETTTDLLPVFLGTGIFGANATLREWSWQDGNMSWSAAERQGYLSSLELGYALALFAFVRGEPYPEWAHHLRDDARETLAKGLRFLRKTGDSLFTPDTIDSPKSPPTAERAMESLTSRSPTVRLSGLWDVIESRISAPELLAPVLQCTFEREASLRRSATQALANFGPGVLDSVPQLVELLADPVAEVRTAAVCTVRVIKPPAREVVPELTRLLLDHDVPGTAAVLRSYGEEAAGCLPTLLDAVEQSLSTYTEATPEYFALLCEICPDPARAIREHLGERDPDVLQLALSELKLHAR